MREVRSLSIADKVILAFAGLGALASYLLLHGRYRPDNVDDVFFLSFAYNYWLRGIEDDLCFGSAAGTGGFGGVAFFGKTFALLYANVLNLMGWTNSAGLLVSTVLILAAACIWAAVLRRLGLEARLTAFFTVLFVTVEPLFGAANQARPDALVFFLASASLLLFICKRWGLAGFAAVVAVEIHPAGCIAFFWWLAVLAAAPEVRRAASRRALVSLAAGLAGGILYYAALHYGRISGVPAAVAGGSRGGPFSMLFEYFFKTKYYRHLPELVLFLGCAIWFCLKAERHGHRVVGALLAASLMFAAVVTRASFMYAVYVYPALLLLVLWSFRGGRKLQVLTAGWLLYLLVQYGFVYVKNRRWNLADYVAQVKTAVPSDSRAVIGRPNDWYAFMERPFFVLGQAAPLAHLGEHEFYLLEDEGVRHEGASSLLRKAAARTYRSQEVGMFARGEERIVVRLFYFKDASS